jgi:type IV secretory pathway component VirB8
MGTSSMKIANRADELKVTFNIIKLLMNICWAQLIFIVVIINYICLCLLPNKEYKHYFLQVRDKSEQVVRVTPIETTKAGKDMLKQQYVKQYVLDRESIDLHTEKKVG